MNFLKTMFGELKTGSMRRLPYFFFALFYSIAVLSGEIFLLKDNSLPFSITSFVIIFMLFLNYIYFVLTVKRFRNLGLKRPILMSSILCWAGYFVLLCVFLSKKFMSDEAQIEIIEINALFFLVFWFALMLIFKPLLLFARENFLNQSLLKLFLGDLKHGQLKRISFLGCSYYFNFLALGILMIIVAVVGWVIRGQLFIDHMTLEKIWQSFLDYEGAIFLVIAALLFGLFVVILDYYVSFLLTVKRIRNIGAKRPIMVSVLLFLSILSVLIAAYISFTSFEAISGNFDPKVLSSVLSVLGGLPSMLLFLVLVFLPQGFVQQRPLRVLFADLEKGSLRRVSFFGYLMLAALITFFCGGIIGIILYLLGDVNANVAKIMATLLFEYMVFVLSVKRLRHINLKNSITLAFIILVVNLIYHGIGYSGYESSLLDSLRTVWLCVDVVISLFLLFAPGNLFNRNGKIEKLESATS